MDEENSLTKVFGVVTFIVLLIVIGIPLWVLKSILSGIKLGYESFIVIVVDDLKRNI